MVAGAAVLWRALVYFWDESLLLIRANLTWFVGSLPLYLLTVGVALLFASPVEAEMDPEMGPALWPWMLSAFVLVVMPSPFSAGVYAITVSVAQGESPGFAAFWQALKRWWKRTLIMYVIGAVAFGALIFNTIFYMSVTTGLLQAVAILWVYAIIFWLTMQAYLLPLLVMSVTPEPVLASDDGWPLDETRERPAPTPPQPTEPLVEPTLGTLYKRAAILALANPFFSLVLFFGTAFTMVLSAIAMPVYPLLAMSYVALINSQALKVLRDKYFPTEARGATG
jgi:uncharacterized membrane protein YesL